MEGTKMCHSLPYGEHYHMNYPCEKERRTIEIYLPYPEMCFPLLYLAFDFKHSRLDLLPQRARLRIQHICAEWIK